MLAIQPKAKGAAQLGVGRRGKNAGSPPDPHLVEITLAEAGISKRIADLARKAASLSPDEFEVKIEDACQRGLRAILKVISTQRTEARRERRQAWARDVKSKTTILRKKIADITERDLGSYTVQAVITDPPYGKDALDVYADLGRFATRVLKGGGWCVVLTGMLFLDRVMDDLRAAGLVYRGMLIFRFPGGPNVQIATLRLYQSWKPILLFQCQPVGSPPGDGMFRDEIVIKVSEHDNKKGHRWQQPETLFRALVERYSDPGDLVADPFAGSGTTLRAAEAVGRHAFGSDDGKTWRDE
jgi:site-specific DNA-methyltransferase (adenine-specific)